MPENTLINVGFGTPFQAQIDYLRKKLRLPTEKWNDIERSAHDRAFVVAGAAKADLLADLHQAVIKAASDGSGLAVFQKDFKAIVAKHGWTGWTGEGTKAGEAWRTRVIYQTNMASSYWAGRYAQMKDPDYIRFHPYWRYLHSDGVLHPRLHHLAWHGITLRHDHPFWLTHSAPNGWGCQCRITTVTKREGEASAKAGLGEPPEGWDKRDPKTGEPIGIDKGFGFQPGANVGTPLRQMVQDKLITYPDAISKALAADIGRYISTTEGASAFAQRVLTDRTAKEPLFLGFVENVTVVSEAAGQDVKGYFVTVSGDAVRHVDLSHSNDGRGQRPPVASDYDKLFDILNQADSIRSGGQSRNQHQTVVATKMIGGETYRAVFEVLPGKRNRALALLSLVIKTK